MFHLKNPFGLRDGHIIMIEDILQNERGKKCHCVCPACQAPLEARMGDIRVHHFAHTGVGCDEEIAFINGLYQLVRECVLCHSIVLPELKVYWAYNQTNFTTDNYFERVSFCTTNQKSNSTLVAASISIKFEKAEIIYAGRRPITLLLSYQSRQLALGIKPPSSICKTYSIKPYKDVATIQLDMTDILFDKMSKEQIIKMIEKRFCTSIWVSNPKAITVIDKINKTNRAWLETVQKEREIQQQRELFFYDKMNKENSPVCKKTEEPIFEVKQYDREEKLRIGYLQVVDVFIQQEDPIRDSFGQRWIKCMECGEIKPDYEFASYGGLKRVNSGTCRACSKKGRPQK